jgi:Protein of unknown function (DUF1501)
MQKVLDTLTRRRLVQLGTGAYLGLNLGSVWRAEAAGGSSVPLPASLKPLKSCILIFYYGGPSHLDTYDLKPDAPAEVRGEFLPINTSVPGLHVCEHLPKMARQMHHVAQIRSVTHQARLHDSASIHALTGRLLEGPDRELFAPQPQTNPCYGSAVTYLRGDRPTDVPFASLPFPFRNVHEVPCQGAGLLGSQFDPLCIEVDPANQRYQIEMLRRPAGLSAVRQIERRALLESLDQTTSSSASTSSGVATSGSSFPAGATATSLRGFYDKAYRLLDSERIRQALDIAQEPAAIRDRYGFGVGPAFFGEGGGGGNGAEMGFARQMRGQNVLLARRLVEAGVPFVNVYDFRQQGQNWDAHFKCMNQHKTHLLPQADQSLAALIADLEDRGRLDTTLVVAMGEFGRTPKINGDAGRDHWPDCYTVLFAGGGVRGGCVYGSSDRLGAFPASDPVTPGDLAATIYWRFGFNPASEVHDILGRPIRLSDGEPIRHLFAG